MTAVSPLIFPGSRTLASWWKQLAPFQPRALWTGHLLLHHIEALASLQLLLPLDRISRFALSALGLSERASLENLDQRLHLGLALLRQLVRRLESAQLVRQDGNQTWSLTELGRQALEKDAYPQLRQERRVFFFVENGQPARPPHFLKFARPPAVLAWPAGDSWRFEPSQLQACVRQPPEWKQRFGFPLDVQQVLGSEAAPQSPAPSLEEWQRIILDRPERLVTTMALASGNDGIERLLGFAVQQEGWVLQSAEPVFAIDGAWQEVFPQLATDVTLDDWRQAWHTWCQPRGLPATEVAACVLERQGYRLRVRAMPRLVERLRAARSDVFRGEAWLLAGTGPIRPAAQIELVETQREKVSTPG